MTSTLTPQECLKLIHCVKENVEIYDPSHEHYKSRSHRELAWENISASVGHPVKTCRTKWRHLRDCFVRGSAKRKHLIKNWVYYEPLSFLNVVVNKKSQYSTSLELDEEDDEFLETEGINAKKFRPLGKCDIDANAVIVKSEPKAPEDEVQNANDADLAPFLMEVAKRLTRLPEDLRNVAMSNILSSINEVESKII